MDEPIVEIRRASTDQAPHAAAAITAAFITEPLVRFGFPSPYDYLQSAPRVFQMEVSESLAHGVGYVSADLCGAALWFPPGTSLTSDLMDEASREAVKTEHLDDFLETFEKMDEWHPEEPHWYLRLLGVEPYSQGKGIGAALMQPVLLRCDQEGALAYLESANPRNIALYERHGFEVMGRIQIGAAPPVVPMLRLPR